MEAKGSLPVVQPHSCALLPQKLVDAKKPGCESSITSESVMILPVSFAESKLCSRQSRHQTLDAWND